jgi:hypothetical protein
MFETPDVSIRIARPVGVMKLAAAGSAVERAMVANPGVRSIRAGRSGRKEMHRRLTGLALTGLALPRRFPAF